MRLIWQSKSVRSCEKQASRIVTTTSSCEEERAADLAAEEECVGLLEALAEDQVLADLDIRCIEPGHECEYRHKCDFEISWMCERTAEIVYRCSGEMRMRMQRYPWVFWICLLRWNGRLIDSAQVRGLC
jgi:hypothetical protein